MISLSRSCSFAFSTLCGMPRRVRSSERYSDVSTAIVPTRTGCPASWRSTMSSATASHLASFDLEDEVVLVGARDGDVRRDLDDVEVVDLDELLLLGLRGAGHPGELLVEAEVVLQRDRRERDVLLADRDALLRLDRLVQALAPAAPFHDPARVLVDDLDLAVLHDVVDVALVERLRLERLRQVVDELHVARVVEVVDPERALDLVERRLRRRDGLELLVVEVVRARELGLVLALHRLAGQRRAVELLDDPREVVVRLRGGLGLAGDDQRRPRLVDQDRVDLVDDRERRARAARCPRARRPCCRGGSRSRTRSSSRR